MFESPPLAHSLQNLTGKLGEPQGIPSGISDQKTMEIASFQGKIHDFYGDFP